MSDRRLAKPKLNKEGARAKGKKTFDNLPVLTNLSLQEENQNLVNLLEKTVVKEEDSASKKSRKIE